MERQRRKKDALYAAVLINLLSLGGGYGKEKDPEIQRKNPVYFRVLCFQLHLLSKNYNLPAAKKCFARTCLFLQKQIFLFAFFILSSCIFITSKRKRKHPNLFLYYPSSTLCKNSLSLFFPSPFSMNRVERFQGLKKSEKGIKNQQKRINKAASHPLFPLLIFSFSYTKKQLETYSGRTEKERKKT